MAVSVRFSDQEENLVKKYAAVNGKTVSEVLRNAIIEKIEEEFDLLIADIAWEAFEKNPKSISHDEIMKEFGLK